jgi:hypothetical protein
MNPFVETISIAGGLGLVLVAVIVVLTLFYRLMGKLSRTDSKPDTLAIRGVLKPNTIVTVHLLDQEIFERVRFVGFTRTEGRKVHWPFELSGMVILEDEQKQRYLVRAKDIRKIVIAPDTNQG